MIWLSDFMKLPEDSPVSLNTKYCLDARLIQQASLKIKSYSGAIKSLHSIQIFVWGIW